MDRFGRRILILRSAARDDARRHPLLWIPLARDFRHPRIKDPRFSRLWSPLVAIVDTPLELKKKQVCTECMFIK